MFYRDVVLLDPPFLSYLFDIYPFLYIFSAIFPKIAIPAHCSLRPGSLYKPRLLICGHPETLHVECSR